MLYRQKLNVKKANNPSPASANPIISDDKSNVLARYTDHGLWRGLRSLPAILPPVQWPIGLPLTLSLYLAGKVFSSDLFQSKRLESKSKREKETKGWVNICVTNCLATKEEPVAVNLRHLKNETCAWSQAVMYVSPLFMQFHRTTFIIEHNNIAGIRELTYVYDWIIHD